MPQAVGNVLDKLLTEVGRPAMLVIFSAGFLLFIWGLVKFLWNVEDSSAKEEGKQHMLYGIMGMFIMVSIWAIIGLIDNTLGLGAMSGNGPATDLGRADQIKSVNFNGN